MIAKPAPARLEIRQVKANGRWADGHLSVPIFALVASDATLHGTIDAEIAARSGGKVTLAIHALPKPVIARIGGPARAGGLGLIGAADIAVCVRSATFAFTEVRLGVIPAVISSTVLPRLAPRTNCSRLSTRATPRKGDA